MFLIIFLIQLAVKSAWTDYFKQLDYVSVTGSNPSAVSSTTQNIYVYATTVQKFTTKVINVKSSSDLKFLIEEVSFNHNIGNSQPGMIYVKVPEGGVFILHKVICYNNTISVTGGRGSFAFIQADNTSINLYSSLDADRYQKSTIANLMANTSLVMTNTNNTRSSSSVIVLYRTDPTKISYSSFENMEISSVNAALWLTYCTISYCNFIRNTIVSPSSQDNANIRLNTDTRSSLISYCCFTLNDCDYAVFTINPQYTVNRCYVDYGRFSGAKSTVVFDSVSLVPMNLFASGAIETALPTTPSPSSNSSNATSPDQFSPTKPVNPYEKLNKIVIIVTAVVSVVILAAVIIWFVVKCVKFRTMKKLASQRLLKSDDENDEATNETNETRDVVSTNSACLKSTPTNQANAISTINSGDLPDSDHSIKIDQDESDHSIKIDRDESD